MDRCGPPSSRKPQQLTKVARSCTAATVRALDFSKRQTPNLPQLTGTVHLNWPSYLSPLLLPLANDTWGPRVSSLSRCYHRNGTRVTNSQIITQSGIIFLLLEQLKTHSAKKKSCSSNKFNLITHVGRLVRLVLGPKHGIWGALAATALLGVTRMTSNNTRRDYASLALQKHELLSKEKWYLSSS